MVVVVEHAQSALSAMCGAFIYDGFASAAEWYLNKESRVFIKMILEQLFCLTIDLFVLLLTLYHRVILNTHIFISLLRYSRVHEYYFDKCQYIHNHRKH